MKTEDIIKLIEKGLNALRVLSKITLQLNLTYGNKLANEMIEEFESSLKSMRDEKEDERPCENCDMPIPCELECEKEENISVREFVIKWGQEGMYDKTFEADVLRLLKSQSSPQPQPGRGAENEIEKLKKEHDDLLFMAGGLTQCHQSNMRHELLIKVHNLKEQIKHLEEYRTQSEGKDMYPKWISVNEKLPKKEKGVKSVPVLVVIDNRIDFMSCDLYQKKWWDKYGNEIKVTHWMPLPEPPKSLVK